MTGALWKLTAAAVAVAVVYLVGAGIVRQHRASARAAAHDSVAVHSGRADVERAGVERAAPGLAAADSNVTRQVRAPRPPAPRVFVVHDTATPAIPAGEYVARAAYDSLAVRLDSTRAAALAYRDSARAVLIRYPRLVAELDSARRWQRVELATPAPRRRCGPSLSAGYGFALVGGVVHTAPSLNVGVGCTL